MPRAQGIYAGAHLLLDIVGGAALDVMVGEAFRVVEATLAERRRA